MSSTLMSVLIVFIRICNVASGLIIIFLVLVQHGKGADAGASLGGGSSQSLFGASGSSNALSKATAAAAVAFFATCLMLAYDAAHRTALLKGGEPTVDSVQARSRSLPDSLPLDNVSTDKFPQKPVEKVVQPSQPADETDKPTEMQKQKTDLKNSAGVDVDNKQLTHGLNPGGGAETSSTLHPEEVGPTVTKAKLINAPIQKHNPRSPVHKSGKLKPVKKAASEKH
ncbi:MAG: preprotein translocase subunit SecG [Neisseriaceae bacterium]